MHAAHVFSGPVPPILPVAGGSMGFLTTFSREEILDAIYISLGMSLDQSQQPSSSSSQDFEDEYDTIDDSNIPEGLQLSTRAANNMLVEDISRESYNTNTIAFGRKNQICISMRMRLDCRIFSGDGSLKSRYNVLNEVVIDRGSSPYLVRLFVAVVY